MSRSPTAWWRSVRNLLGLGAQDSSRTATPQIRVGQGFDIHRFSDDPGRTLVLAGCEFPGERGLAGHSDADAIAHSCSDALLGAAGLGDIGMHFPDTDDRWRGADSITLLRHVMSMLATEGWSVNNIDCAVICERPKLAPRRVEMQEVLSSTVGAPVSIKGNRAEQLGALGRTEGIACFATALIQRTHPSHQHLVDNEKSSTT